MYSRRKKQSYNVMDVSRYIINYSNKKDYSISNLKLQKLLYFIQVYFLVKHGKECFGSTIEAWAFGPVVPEAYREFKRFGGGEIPPVKSWFVFEEEGRLWSVRRIEYDDKAIRKRDKRRINQVVDLFANYSSSDMTELTLNQAPWEAAYKKAPGSAIQNESLNVYFSQNI